MNNKPALQPIPELAKPILRWAGSKRKIVPILKDYWSDNNSTYIEPFAGSAQLFFAISPENAILGDTNSELIDLYKDIKTDYEELYDLIKKFEPTKFEYYKLRSKKISELTQLERSARLLCLNRFCFNGLYRTNKKGEFNVPFTNGRNGQLPTLKELRDVSNALINVELSNDDFEKLIKENVKKNDFVYLDPPYAISNSKIFTQYGPHSFGTNDIERMKTTLDFINAKGGNFLLSYAKCKESEYLAKEWNSSSIIIQRNIAGFSAHRKIESELLITNLSIK